jgi:DNA uptake protein ComE-like DNA-binding protein
MTKPSGKSHRELTPRVPVRRAAPVVRQVLWASVPVWSIGFLSFVPSLAYAIMRRRRADWAVFAAFLAATIGLIVAAGTVGSGNGGGTAAFGGFIIALAGCAAVHAAVVFRPGNAPAAPGAASGVAPGTRQHNKDAIAEAKDRIERRKDARRLAETDPALARDLHIGRPDVPRDYDDGGLVDVNHVPGAVLATGLGLSPDEVTDVIAARDKLGRFTSADELCAYTDLSPDRVDELRDLMIFS